jgi:hypothetical protein
VPLNTLKSNKKTYQHVPTNAAKSFTSTSNPIDSNTTNVVEPLRTKSTRSTKETQTTITPAAKTAPQTSKVPAASDISPKTPSYNFAKTASARKMSLGDIRPPALEPPPFRKTSLPDLNPNMTGFPVESEDMIGIARTQPLSSLPVMAKPTLVNHRPTSALSSAMRPKTAGGQTSNTSSKVSSWVAEEFEKMEANSTTDIRRIPDQLSLFPRPRTAHGESKSIISGSISNPSEPGSAATFKSEIAARPLPPLPPELKLWPPPNAKSPRTEVVDRKLGKSKHGFSFWKFRWGKNGKKHTETLPSTW